MDWLKTLLSGTRRNLLIIGSIAGLYLAFTLLYPRTDPLSAVTVIVIAGIAIGLFIDWLWRRLTEDRSS
jgi:hypothetical protein